MKTLELDYPKTGAGIDFQPLLADVPTNPTGIESKVILSASGRSLNTRVGQNLLYVKDADRTNQDYLMEAFVDRNRILRFMLFTRLAPKLGGIQTPVHPDFFAGKFVGVALSHLQRFGRIDSIVSEWGEKSVGYRSFMEAYEMTDDKIGSAKKTWSWKTFSEHGFCTIKRVVVDLDPLWGKSVTTTFTRPNY